MTDQTCILLFVKAPEKGQVKTRLAADIGGDSALRLYECLVLDSVEILKRSGIPFRICYSPPEALDKLQNWLGRDIVFLPQSGADVGERMERAFIHLFQEGMQRVIIIGSDILGLCNEMLEHALHELDSHDTIIGPALDGGYYLIGFTEKGFERAVFQNMTWSTDTVFEETMRRLAKSGHKVSVLPQLRDIDRKEDMEEFLECSCRQDEIPRTMAFLLDEMRAGLS
ncbi:MAG TPA: TIGR04282 family arsenosugar biosynthesis glycosyltransferase [Nitrospirota bacterium]|nr:TIGR04282 family arsenosugar biosynthesis glycosyltransferase [Nitrospirota bacterium]